MEKHTFFLTELGHLVVDEINYLADKLYDMEENEDEFNDFQIDIG